MHECENGVGPGRRKLATLGAALLAAGCAAGLAMTTAPSASAASGNTCVVTDNKAPALKGIEYPFLQWAVNAAGAGDTLQVYGTCVDPTTITKNLTIIGGGSTATLDGGQLGSVLTIPTGITANVSGLQITNGKATNGGGIANHGTLNLSKAQVMGNVSTGGSGAGIYFDGAGLNLDSDVLAGNTGAYKGGGVYLNNYLTAQFSNTAISPPVSRTGSPKPNVATYGGGVYVGFQATAAFTKNSTVTGNTATYGPDVFNYWGTVTTAGAKTVNVVNASSLPITCDVTLASASGTQHYPTLQLAQDAAPSGTALTLNGVCAGDTTLTKSLGVVGGFGSYYTPEGSPGVKPVYLPPTAQGTLTINAGSTVDLLDSLVVSHKSLTSYDSGTGIINHGNLTLDTGTVVTDNKVAGNGGGIYNDGTLQVGHGSITNNSAAHGAGVFDTGGGTSTFSSNATITGNVASDQGGAVYVDQGATATLGGTFGSNTGQGKDAYNHYGTVTFDPVLGLDYVSPCDITDTHIANTHYGTLALGVAVASTTDNLEVSGTCPGQTVIDKKVTIDHAAGAATATLDGGGTIGPVLAINPDGNVIVHGLTITGGYSAGYGAGIENDGTLELDNSAVTGNSADLGGAGIDNYGTLTLLGTTVSSNSTFGNGAGIYNVFGVIELAGSTVSDNSAAGNGGGMYNDGGTVSLGDSTISGNTAVRGAGVYNLNGALTLNGSSTITANTASVGGGGVLNWSGGTTTLRDTSTVTGNIPDDIVG